MQFFCPKSIFFGNCPNFLLLSWLDTKKTTFLYWLHCMADHGPAAEAHFWPKNLFFLRYTHITPLFWARIDPTWWDHISPISWGNSGYLQFLGRWPFGRSAGRFTAPIAQSGLFRVKNAVFRPETHFSETSSKKIVPIVTGHQKDNSFVLTHCMADLWGGGRVHFWPKIDPKSCLFSCYTL